MLGVMGSSETSDVTKGSRALSCMFTAFLVTCARAKGAMRRDWAMAVCFSCGKAGHGVSRCPKLNETFPFMLPGWTADRG